MLAASAAVWVLSAAGVWVLTGGARAPATRTIEIPDGTYLAVARGENPLDLPPSWDFVAGDTLLLVNHDRVSHQVGPWFAPAGATVEVRLSEARSASVFCTVHPASEISLEVRPSGFDWRLTLLPVAVLGPALGLLSLLLRGLWRVLDPTDAAGESSEATPVR